MFFWGICSAVQCLGQGPNSFVIVRFMLGVAEAGFFPGVAFFMTRWFPSRHRGKAMGVFYATGARPGSSAARSSGNLLRLNGWLGFAGWQWIFLVEAIPARCCLRGSDAAAGSPADARLAEARRTGLAGKQAGRGTLRGPGRASVRLGHQPGDLMLMLVYLLIGFGVYAKRYLPAADDQEPWATATNGRLPVSLPAIAGVVGMIIFSRSSDRTGERLWHLAFPACWRRWRAAGVRFHPGVNPMLAIAASAWRSLAFRRRCRASGICPPHSWAPPRRREESRSINAIGNISGYVAPQMVGVLRDATGSYEVPMVAASLFMLAAAICILLSPRVAARPILARVRVRR